MHRFYVNQELTLGECAIDGLQIVHQLVKVLRMKPGATVIFFDGSGYDYHAEIILFSKESLRVRIVKKEENRRELPVRLILCYALVKKDRMEWLLEKATEVGVAGFMPMITDRSIPKEFQIERFRKIIREATEQSGRPFLPDIQEPIAFSEALMICGERRGQGILFHPGAKEALLSEIVHPEKHKHVFLFIGPEGGFTGDELTKARMAGVMVTSPYPTILRAETAGVVFPALIGSLYGQYQR